MGDYYTHRPEPAHSGNIRRVIKRCIKLKYTKENFIQILAALHLCAKFPQEDTSSLLKACDTFLRILLDTSTAVPNEGAFSNLQNKFDSTVIQEKGPLFEYLKTRYMSANLYVLSDQIMAFIAMAGLQYNVPQLE